MFNDPGWPFGIAFLILAISMRKVLPRLIDSMIHRHDAEAAGQAAAREEELEQLRHRVLELEERVDFTERLLRQQREAQPLGKGEE